MNKFNWFNDLNLKFSKYGFLKGCMKKYIFWITAIFIVYIPIILTNKKYIEPEGWNLYDIIKNFIKSAFNLSGGTIHSLTIVIIIFHIIFSGYLAFKFIQKKCALELSDYIYIRNPEDPDDEKLKDSVQLNYRIYNKNYKFESFININKDLELIRIMNQDRIRVVSRLDSDMNIRKILELSTNYNYNFNRAEHTDGKLMEFLINSINGEHEENENMLLRAVVTAQSTDNGQIHTKVKYYESKKVIVGDYKSFYEVIVNNGEPKFIDINEKQFNKIVPFEKEKKSKILDNLIQIKYRQNQKNEFEVE